MTAGCVLGGVVSNGRGGDSELAGIARVTEAITLGLLVGARTRPVPGPNVCGGS